MNCTDMSLIALLDDSFKPEDFSEESGFIGIFYHDKDRPSSEKEIFLAYDDSVRTEQSIDRAIRFSRQATVKSRFVRYISGTPVIVYKYWVSPKISDIVGMHAFSLSCADKLKILDFWGTDNSELLEYILQNNLYYSDNKTWTNNNTLPAGDYNGSIIEK